VLPWSEYGALFQRSMFIFLVCAAAVIAALILHRIVYAIACRFSRRTSSIIDDRLLHHSDHPSRAILALLALMGAVPGLRLTDGGAASFRHVIGLALIACVGWLAISILKAFHDVLSARYRVDVEDNLRARRVQTQVSVLQSVLNVIIVVITIAVMLMTFPSVRQVGQSLFASAGIAALVAGIAARSTFSNLIAGLQIALTEPIRLDDVVIVEGEWGRVETITTTYVVVRIWDERRLVVPLSKFIEEPFQNWTMKTADLLGTVFIYADYSVPVDVLRKELHQVLQSTTLWDGKVWGLQVTDATENTVQLRALMSAADSSAAFDLRCYVREKLITFLQGRYPESLPRIRTDLSGQVLARCSGEQLQATP